MARHDQRPTQGSAKYVCRECQQGNCEGCIDVLRAKYTNLKLCMCVAVGHKE